MTTMKAKVRVPLICIMLGRPNRTPTSLAMRTTGTPPKRGGATFEMMNTCCLKHSRTRSNDCWLCFN